jgi:hypothetical protein
VADDKTLRLLLVGEDKSASRALKDVGDEAEKTESRLSKVGTRAGGILGAARARSRGLIPAHECGAEPCGFGPTDVRAGVQVISPVSGSRVA